MPRSPTVARAMGWCYNAPMAIGDPFLLGVNYWPRRKAMYWWANFDAGEVREEFSIIRDIGLTHVRFFLLWESFQPKPDLIDPTAMRNLRTVCDIAAELGLKLEPTFFTGHMSGPNWAPDWMLSDRPRGKDDRQLVSLTRHTGSPYAIHNIYTTPFIVEAAKLQLRTICGALRDHPAIWGWSLGNEPDLFCQPPTAAIGRQWVAEMVQTIKSADPNHPVLVGLCGTSWCADVGFRIDHVAQVSDISVMHGYSIYHPDLARRPLDPDYVPFACSLTAALAGRPVLYEEFGLCTRNPDQPSGYAPVTLPYGHVLNQWFSSEADGATYYAEVMPRLQRVGALGGFAWCFADYERSLWDKPPCDYVTHERFFGLVRPDGTLKPAAQAIQAFAKTRPKVQAPERKVVLDVTPDEFYQDPWAHYPRLYEQFGVL